MKKKVEVDVRWLDIACPTCGAGPSQGCLVFGRETMMKHRLKPHLSRVKEAGKAMNSRQLAEEIFNKAVRPVYAGMGVDNEPEPEDCEAMLQTIEGILERKANVKPDRTLTILRKAAGEES